MVNPHAAAYSYGRSTPSSKKAYRTVLFTVNQTPRGQCSILTHLRVFGNEGLLLFASARLQESYISALYGSYLRMRPQSPPSTPAAPPAPLFLLPQHLLLRLPQRPSPRLPAHSNKYTQDDPGALHFPPSRPGKRATRRPGFRSTRGLALQR